MARRVQGYMSASGKFFKHVAEADYDDKNAALLKRLEATIFDVNPTSFMAFTKNNRQTISEFIEAYNNLGAYDEQSDLRENASETEDEDDPD